MNTHPRISATDEHKMLTTELRENKKYIFERPLITVGAILAIANFADKQDPIVLSFLPPICIALLYFNLWFTVNRLRSGSRIIAYIHLVLEKNILKNWTGWESLLSEARKRKDQIKEGMLSQKWDHYTQNNFYSPIYWFHVIIVVLAFLASILLFYSYTLQTIDSGNVPSELIIWITRLALLSSTLLFLFFLRYILFAKEKNPRPSRVVKLGSILNAELAVLIGFLNSELEEQESGEEVL